MLRLLNVSVVLLFSCVCTDAVGQGSINGTVKDAVNAAVSTATVSLLQAKDSSWIQSTYSDDKGAFVFDKMANGSYLVSVSYVGYETGMKPAEVTDKAVTVNVILQKKATELKETVVTAKKQLIENGLGKTTVNVDVLQSSSGTNLLDLLRKMPGVSVSATGSISMTGKNGVLVMIDDKQTYMSADQLAEYLKGLTADEVAQVELITQPSAKYDAAGSAGIINIKMKKSRKQGWTGMVNATYGQATHLSSNDDVQLNYHSRKFGFTSGISISGFQGFQDMTIDRNFRDPVSNNITTQFHQPVVESEDFYRLPGRLGADYSLTDKDVIGANLTGMYHPNNEYNNSMATLTDMQTGISTYNRAMVSNRSLRKNLIGNVYYKHSFSKESELNASLDYAYYDSRVYQLELNHNYDQNMQEQPDPLTLRSTLPSYVNVYSGKIDYNTTLKNKVKLETGAKSSLVSNDNIAAYEAYTNGQWAPDAGHSNHFVYKEQISAVYANASREIGKKIQAQVGLRAEHTLATGKQSVGNQEFTKNYVSLFPTAYVSYDMDKDNHFELNYGRRIDRPNYELLNPFRNSISQYNYQTGNPELQPQFTHNANLKHVYKNMLTTNVSYSITNDVVSSIYTQDNANNVTAVSVANLAQNRTLDVSETFVKELLKGWTANVYAEYFYNMFDGVANGQKMKVSGPGTRLGVVNDVKFKKDWAAECAVYLGGYMQSDLLEVDGPTIYTSMSISKKINNDTTVRLNIRDPFKIYNATEMHNGPGIDSHSSSSWDTREIALTVSWKFGRKQENALKHENNDIEEAKRIKM